MAVVAVFDIGKTNKKLFLFDEQYRIVLERSTHLEETVDEDGDACENLAALTSWIRTTFEAVTSLPDFEVKAVNCSTYGASLVHLGEDGRPATPLYNYLKPFPQPLQARFYAEYGGEPEFARKTASPVLGHLNSGMGLYRLRHQKPEVFKSIAQSLHLPQFVSSLFTGKKFSDLTSVGCHTNLWDFETQSYHEWVKREGLLDKLAPIASSDKVVEFVHRGHKMNSGIGLHDSSSALIPYLASFHEPFTLISTGTWCISLNPFNHEPLTDSDLRSDCLCYLTFQGKPVKASRLFSGYFHEQQCKRLSGHFGLPEDYYQSVCQRSDWRNLQPAPPSPTNDFASVDLAIFSTYETAYVALMSNLVTQQVVSTKLVLQSNTKNLYVDGGFSGNLIYMEMLAESLPQVNLYAAKVVQAAALGAAMAIHDAWNTNPIPAGLLELKEISR